MNRRDAKNAEFPFTVTPAKAGVHGRAFAMAEEWIPAFAGMTSIIFLRALRLCGEDKRI